MPPGGGVDQGIVDIGQQQPAGQADGENKHKLFHLFASKVVPPAGSKIVFNGHCAGYAPSAALCCAVNLFVKHPSFVMFTFLLLVLFCLVMTHDSYKRLLYI